MAGFYVYTADGDHIASIDEIASDPSLVTDPVKTSEPFMPCDAGAPYFFYRPRGASGGKGGPIEAGPAHPINVKAGMQYIRYYGRTFPGAFRLPEQWKGSYAEAYYKDGPRHICDDGKGPRHFGNGEVAFEPAAGRSWIAALASSENVAENLDGGLHAADAEKGFSFAVDFATPNIFPSGRVTGTATGAGTIALVPEAKGAKEAVVWTGKAGETQKLDLDLGPQLRGPCPRAFRLVFKMEKGARLEGLRASGVFQYNYFMAPCLRPGENQVRVAWEGDAKAVRVVWCWKEKGGAAKEDIHVAKKSGEEYTIKVGDLDAGRPALDPTFVEAMIVEAE
jgi:hypothetical protein